MNDKLKNYTAEPDAAVWQRISHTLARRKAVRRTAWASAALLAAGAVVLLALHREEPPMVAELSAPVEEQTLQQASVQNVPQTAVAPSTPDRVTANVRQETESRPAEVQVAENVPVAPSRESTAAPAESPVAREAVHADDVSVLAQPIVSVASPTTSPTVETPTAEENLPAKSPANNGVSNVPDMLLWFPNVFAPASDNDEINRFRAQLSKEGVSLKDFRMAIYNRAGARVFYSTDLREAWDGTRDGQPLPQSAYVYVVFYTDSNGLQHHCKGTVTLVR